MDAALCTRFQHDTLPDADLVGLRVSEGMSKLFDVEVDLLADDPDLDLERLLWSTALVLLEDPERGPVRYFSGIIEEAAYVHARLWRHRYRLRLRPLIHGLAYRVRTRIFQNLDAVQIARKVLSEAGLPDSAFDWSRVHGRYAKRAFTMQYKESELGFVMRLLEHEGIFYWFEHSPSGHVMCFGDGRDAYRPIDGTARLSARRGGGDGRHEVRDLRLTTKLCAELAVERDWDWQQPRKPLEGQAAGDDQVGSSLYEFPGGFGTNARGVEFAQVRLDEARREKFLLEAATSCDQLAPCRTVHVEGTQPAYIAREYVVLDVEHVFHQAALGAEPPHGEPPYLASFRAVPSEVVFRPPRVTPKPRVLGTETAVVTGTEEIHVDEYGRIKVHFYFDREGAIDEHASCWIRVQQQNTSGGMILPRRGWELSIGFEHGDPDRPVALQKLYNGETMPPYGLPAHKTQSALQTSTSPGGGSTNEIRMQDAAGGMQFAINASRDLQMKAGAKLSESIGASAHEEVGAALTTAVVGSESVSIGGAQSISVTGSSTSTTNASKMVTIGGSDSLGVTGNASVACDGSRTETIGGMMNVLANSVSETFGASCTRSVAAAQSIASATAIIEAVGGAKKEIVGGAKLEICSHAKAEQVGGIKTLAAGFMKEKSGKDIGYSAKGAVAFQVAGAIAEKCSGDFNCGAKVIVVTAPGGITISGGGTPYTLRGADITVDAGQMAIKGTEELKLDGSSIDYKP